MFRVTLFLMIFSCFCQEKRFVPLSEKENRKKTPLLENERQKTCKTGICFISIFVRHATITSVVFSLLRCLSQLVGSGRKRFETTKKTTEHVSFKTRGMWGFLLLFVFVFNLLAFFVVAVAPQKKNLVRD